MENQTQEKPKVYNNRTYIEDRFQIVNKRGELVPFRFNKAQDYYWRKRTRRNIILKARQKGLTKVIDADQLVDVIRKPATMAVVVSHEKTATQRLFAAVKKYTETMKKRPRISIDSKSEIKIPYKGSSYFIGTAGQKAFGRGDTIARVHLSEAAFYPDLERILTGIEEAAEFGRIDIESTPNGRDYFYQLWQKAKSGKSSYTPIFIPWFIDGEYSKDSLTEKEIEGMSVGVRKMFDMDDDVFMKTLDEKERDFIARVKKEWGIEITPGMMKWRRYKIWDKGDLFFQEYPEDDVSCFLQSGRSVFNKVVCDPTKMVPLDDFDNWKEDKLKKGLMQGRMMYGGVDGAEGTATGDRHNFSVIDVDPETQKGYVVFEITSNDPIDVFWTKVKYVVDRFHIHLGIEKNGLGLAHVRKARELGVPFIEWETTGTTRPVMITELEEAYRKEELIETYPEAENELRDMEYKDNNRAEHKQGGHDDRVFGRAIAWQMRKIPQAGVEFI